MTEPDLETELAEALGRTSAENDTDTPDVILATFLSKCLAAWHEAVLEREKWYERDEPKEPKSTTTNTEHEYHKAGYKCYGCKMIVHTMPCIDCTLWEARGR